MINSSFGQHFDDSVPGDEGFELHEGGFDMGDEMVDSDEMDDFQEELKNAIEEVFRRRDQNRDENENQ